MNSSHGGGGEQRALTTAAVAAAATVPSSSTRTTASCTTWLTYAASPESYIADRSLSEQKMSFTPSAHSRGTQLMCARASKRGTPTRTSRTEAFSNFFSTAPLSPRNASGGAQPAVLGSSNTIAIVPPTYGITRYLASAAFKRRNLLFCIIIWTSRLAPSNGVKVVLRVDFTSNIFSHVPLKWIALRTTANVRLSTSLGDSRSVIRPFVASATSLFAVLTASSGESKCTMLTVPAVSSGCDMNESTGGGSLRDSNSALNTVHDWATALYRSRAASCSSVSCCVVVMPSAAASCALELLAAPMYSGRSTDAIE
eukprot:PhM_4_TR19115/c0_g2_i1/m.81064